MSKKLTLYLLSSSGSPVKQVSIHKSLIWFSVLTFVTLIALLAYGFNDYYGVKKSLASAQQVEGELAEQRQIIEHQRLQIQTFAEKMNQLKAAVVNLNDFEKKLRIIANLELKDNSDNMYGVGGSIPEDLDPGIPLSKEHDSLVREMHDQAGQLMHASSLQEQSFQSLMKALEKKRNILAATPSIAPAKGWKTSGFGYRKSPFTGKKELHKGLDIASKMGTPIIAPAKGVVTYSGNKWLLGKTITIDHGFGIVTRYGHMSKLLKKRGDKVQRGDIIGQIGSTGRSTGPHLHYEIRMAGIPVNPEKYILD